MACVFVGGAKFSCGWERDSGNTSEADFGVCQIFCFEGCGVANGRARRNVRGGIYEMLRLREIERTWLLVCADDEELWCVALGQMTSRAA